MRVVCAYCGEVVRDEGEPTSHGMCERCADHFSRLSEGMSLSEYLDTLPDPVIVLDAQGRVLGANQKIASLFGRDRVELRGVVPGQAFACARSRLPEGCGASIHCRECTIRRALAHLHETGEAVQDVRAWMQTERGFVHVRVSMTVEDALVKVTVAEVGEAMARA